MSADIFSRRHQFRPEPEKLVYDNVPFYVRSDFLGILREFIEQLRKRYQAKFLMNDYTAAVDAFYEQVVNRASGESLPLTFEWKVYKALGRHLREALPKNPMNGPHYHIGRMIEKCNWYEFYDVSEIVYRIIFEEFSKEEAENFASQLNAILRNEGMGYQFREGKIERVDSLYQEKVIQETKALLLDKRFSGPAQQFDGALNHYNKRPEMETDDAIKDAVGALEGVARILANDPTAILSQILKRPKFTSNIDPILIEAMQRVYAYRGSEPGIAHGQTEVSKVGSEEATLMLGLCAAFMVYLAKRMG